MTSNNQANRHLAAHTFRMTGYSQADLFTGPEQRSHTIEMKVHLQGDITSKLPKLQAELVKDNMSVSRLDRNNDIVISGIPPDTAFALNAESLILKKVREYDTGARVVPTRTPAGRG